MSALVEKILVLTISVILSAGAILLFANEVIPLLRQILEAYRSSFTQALILVLDLQKRAIVAGMAWIWST